MIDLVDLRRLRENSDLEFASRDAMLDVIERQTWALLDVEWVRDGPCLVCPACLRVGPDGHYSRCSTDDSLNAIGLDTREKRDAERKRASGSR